MANKKEKILTRQGSISENFYAVNHASLILPKRGSTSEPVKNMKRLQFGGDLKTHLYAIIRAVRPRDQIKLVARLESWVETHVRYLVIVSTVGRQDTEESLILGIDFAEGTKDECTIGFTIPIWNDVTAELDGDGGFDIKVPAKHRSFSFKPVSVQAMWSALHTLHHCISIARYHNYFTGSLFLTWTCYYESCIRSSRIFINEWEHDENLANMRPNYFSLKDKEQEATEAKIRGALKQVLMRMDLDNCKSRDIRNELEKVIDLDLSRYKSYIDNEMVTLLRQMDTASKIFDFLYLGSAWNAADEEELKLNGITHILNISMIVDNFFPEDIVYKNIRLYDSEDEELLPWWNDTYKFIKHAIMRGGKCLVHCRMGISRSSSTVTAFVMKEKQWSMEKALNYVRERRPIASPNAGFMEQLREYEGILKASSQRHNVLFRSLSESNLAVEQSSSKKEDNNSSPSSVLLQGSYDYHRHLLDITSGARKHKLKRSKSWTAGDSKFEDEDIMREELYGDENTEPCSEPQNISSKSARNDKRIELTTITKYGSKKKKKFKRRHTETAFGWQSTETDAGVRSDESMIANSDCGIPTHRFSWDQSSVTSSEESESISAHPFSKSNRRTSQERDPASGDKKDMSSLSKSSRMSLQYPDAIDEVFEGDDSNSQETDPVLTQTSVKNLVNSIESKCFVKTHSRQSSSEKDFIKTTRSSMQQYVESEITVVPEVSILENQNSNNNGMPNANSDDTKASPVAISHEDDANKQRKGYQTLSEDQLRIIREVGKTFIGEIPPKTDNLLMENDSETYKSQGSNGTVRKGLVRKMARAIEEKHSKSVNLEILQSVYTTSANAAKDDCHDTTPQFDRTDDFVDISSCATDTAASSVVTTKEKDVASTEQSRLPHIFSVVAPTPYHQFQKSIKTGKSIKKSISSEIQRYRRGVTRSLSERSRALRAQTSVKDSTKYDRDTVTSGTQDSKHDSGHAGNTTDTGLGSWGKQGGVHSRKEGEISGNNMNRIDRQNSLYKSI